MPKILHTAKYSGLPLDILQKACPKGFVVKTLDEATYEQLLKEVVDADYFLVSGRLPIDRSVLGSAAKLKMIQRTGVGIEMLDLEELKKTRYSSVCECWCQRSECGRTYRRPYAGVH